MFVTFISFARHFGNLSRYSCLHLGSCIHEFSFLKFAENFFKGPTTLPNIYGLSLSVLSVLSLAINRMISFLLFFYLRHEFPSFYSFSVSNFGNFIIFRLKSSNLLFQNEKNWVSEMSILYYIVWVGNTVYSVLLLLLNLAHWVESNGPLINTSASNTFAYTFMYCNCKEWR